ncbi:MAG: saposin domain-containing protein [Solirubrobacterales bacterium]
MRPAARILATTLATAGCLLSFGAAQTQAKSDASVTCSTCHYLVAVVQEHLAHPQHPSEQHVVHVVEHACGWFPEGHKRACHELLENHGTALIDHILRDPHPYRHICQEVGVCAGGKRALAVGLCGGGRPTSQS